MSNSASNIMAHHDPTDVVFTNPEATDGIIEQLDKLSEEFDMDEGDGKHQKLYDAIYQMKQKLFADKDMLPISLKKPGKDVHTVLKNMGGDDEEDEPEFEMEQFNWGSGTKANDLSGITDSMSIPFKMKDNIYDSTMSIPIVSHPGAGNGKNDPFERVASTKMEPSIKGSDAKLGMMNQDWFDHPKIKEALGKEGAPFLESIKSLMSMGSDKIGNATKARKFNKDEITTIKQTLKDIMSHGEDGDVGRPLLKIKEALGANGDKFIDKLISGDNILDDSKPEAGHQLIKGKGKDTIRDNMSPEQYKKVQEVRGKKPDQNYRSKVRTRVKQLAYIRLIQKMRETGNGDKLGKLLYGLATKKGGEFSPHVMVG